MNKKKKIFISTTSFGQFSTEPFELLSSKNIEYKINDKGRKLTEEELPKMLKNIDGVIAGTEVYSKNTLDQLPELKVISRVGIGLDNIDLDYVQKKNITVLKTSTSPSAAVAELTLGLILDLLRKITFHNNNLKNKIWKKEMGSLLYNKTLGVIGLGRVGKELIKLLKGFDLTFFAHDIDEDVAFSKKFNIKYCNLDDLLSKSDIIVIHLSLSDQTKKIINLSALKKMKKPGIIINTSRGEVVDEDGLLYAIKNNIIAGAGLDVFNKEPYNGPLSKYSNVIITPHIGSYAKEVRVRMELESVKNLIRNL